MVKNREENGGGEERPVHEGPRKRSGWLENRKKQRLMVDCYKYATKIQVRISGWEKGRTRVFYAAFLHDTIGA